MPLDVASLRIVKFPAPVLRTKAKLVAEINEDVRNVAMRMIELMREAEGVGLAAPQVGLGWRMFVADVPPTPKRPADEAGEERDARSPDSDPPTATRGPQIYINPQIVRLEGDLEGAEEGCLSLPDINGEVRRPPIATISALDLNGAPFTARAGGLLARCWQHEQDHLDGVLIIDRMTQMSRLKNRTAIRDMEREGGDA